ncbi:MbtH family NRPS accessory protein [Nocardia brevicatena]|uniref:MbtH family NRPS accessory protein n=1 Tax=Nocardia brevicatena TaxID=37327 RepID=UPI0009FEA938
MLVVANDDEQYAIWPTGQPVPAGRQQRYGPAALPECRAFIRRVWVGPRPRRPDTSGESHRMNRPRP